MQHESLIHSDSLIGRKNDAPMPGGGKDVNSNAGTAWVLTDTVSGFHDLFQCLRPSAQHL